MDEQEWRRMRIECYVVAGGRLSWLRLSDDDDTLCLFDVAQANAYTQPSLQQYVEDG